VLFCGDPIDIGQIIIDGSKLFVLTSRTAVRPGIDVGTKAGVHALIATLAEEGIGNIIVASESPAVLGMRHRVLIMREGRIVKRFSHEKATEETIVVAATGHAPVA
jgi:ABC-type sugar transport system ATPase subunit